MSLKSRLIESWTNRFVVGVTTAGVTVAVNDDLQKLVSFVPDEWQAVALSVIGLVTIVLRARKEIMAALGK